MSRVQLQEIAPEIIENSDELKIVAPVTDATVLIDGDFVCTHILRKFSYWSFDSELLTASTEISEFINYFQTYARVRQEDFYRLWQALRAEYDPIENYNQIEIIKHGEIIASGTSSTATDGTNNGTDTNVQSGDIEYTTPDVTTETYTPEITTTTTNGTTVSTQERTTYDSTTFNDVEKLTNEQETGDTTTISGNTITNTVSHDANDKTTFNNVTNARTTDNTIHNETATTTEYNTVNKTVDTANNFNTYSENKLTRSGNIGVTTSQQMVESEIALRLKCIVEEYIDLIINSFCYLALTYESGGENDINILYI